MRLNSVSTMKVASFPCAPSRRMRLIVTIVCALLAYALTSAEAADDAAAAARATLARIQALRKERPNDGVLVFYQALIHVSLGERDAAFQLLRSLRGRKLGLIPVRDTGCDRQFVCRALSTGRYHQECRRSQGDGNYCRAAPALTRSAPPNRLEAEVAKMV
jgi:hypothetical protein